MAEELESAYVDREEWHEDGVAEEHERHQGDEAKRGEVSKQYAGEPSGGECGYCIECAVHEADCFLASAPP